MDAEEPFYFMVTRFRSCYLCYEYELLSCDKIYSVFGQKPRANLGLLNDLPEDTVVDESNLNLEFEVPIYPTDYHLEMEENEEIENENSITELEVNITL